MITLVLGGARSGKSEVAERIAGAAGGPVTYVATASTDDGSMLARVEAHRRRRPPDWATVEVGPGGALGAALAGLEGTALVDSLGPWLAGFPDFATDSGDLCGALLSRAGDTVVVSDEVGLGVHPSTEAGNHFRDRLGLLNRAVSLAADRVLLVVAGRALELGGPA